MTTWHVWARPEPLEKGTRDSPENLHNRANRNKSIAQHGGAIQARIGRPANGQRQNDTQQAPEETPGYGALAQLFFRMKYWVLYRFTRTWGFGRLLGSCVCVVLFGQLRKSPHGQHRKHNRLRQVYPEPTVSSTDRHQLSRSIVRPHHNEKC